MRRDDESVVTCPQSRSCTDVDKLLSKVRLHCNSLKALNSQDRLQMLTDCTARFDCTATRWKHSEVPNLFSNSFAPPQSRLCLGVGEMTEQSSVLIVTPKRIDSPVFHGKLHRVTFLRDVRVRNPLLCATHHHQSKKHTTDHDHAQRHYQSWCCFQCHTLRRVHLQWTESSPAVAVRRTSNVVASARSSCCT